MIVTVTLNPSIDVGCRCAHVSPDRKLRCKDVTYDAGGGGLNVCRVIRELGGEASALWISGGEAGRRLNRLIEQAGVPGTSVSVEGETRLNTYVHEDASDREFRFILPGPRVSDAELGEIRDRLANLEGVDYLVLSGSVPPDVPEDCYAALAREASGARVVVDASGGVLPKALETDVFLAKPNLRELADLSGRDDLDGDAQIVDAARRVVRQTRVQFILASLGSGGAALVSAEDSIRVHAPTVRVRSKVGAGDSMVAGVVLAFARGMAAAEAVRFGVAAGSAAVTTPGTQLCRREDVERIHSEISVDG